MKGYHALGEHARKVLNETHAKHMGAMGSSEKEKYTRGQIKEVKLNQQEQVIEVRFRNGELFKYTKAGTWY
ncbi:hypothetical protein [Salibacterium lacus]|uniref:Uncharacterized protein n=1 Tax=Salibacterium lacus TaxID=1898109 RepID=A0ABW5T0H0_9BACI